MVKLGKLSEADVKTRVDALKEEEHFSSGTNSDHDDPKIGSGGTGSVGPGTPEFARKEEQVLEKNKGVSLLEQHKELQEIAEEKKESLAEKQKKEEAEILARIAETTALKGVAELASGVTYTESIKTSWTPPRYIQSLTMARHRRVWKKYCIEVDGDNPPPPLKTFEDMKLNYSKTY